MTPEAQTNRWRMETWIRDIMTANQPQSIIWQNYCINSFLSKWTLWGQTYDTSQSKQTKTKKRDVVIFKEMNVIFCIYRYRYIYLSGAGHIIRISSKSWFISLIPFKKWNLYNVYIHSTQTDIFQVFISFNFDDYKWQLMKTPNSVSQKIRILWKGSILKTPGATL